MSNKFVRKFSSLEDARFSTSVISSMAISPSRLYSFPVDTNPIGVRRYLYLSSEQMNVGRCGLSSANFIWQCPYAASNVEKYRLDLFTSIASLGEYQIMKLRACLMWYCKICTDSYFPCRFTNYHKRVRHSLTSSHTYYLLDHISDLFPNLVPQRKWNLPHYCHDVWDCIFS